MKLELTPATSPIRLQVNRFRGALHKGFNSHAKARDYLDEFTQGAGPLTTTVSFGSTPRGNSTRTVHMGTAPAAQSSFRAMTRPPAEYTDPFGGISVLARSPPPAPPSGSPVRRRASSAGRSRQRASPASKRRSSRPASQLRGRSARSQLPRELLPLPWVVHFTAACSEKTADAGGGVNVLVGGREVVSVALPCPSGSNLEGALCHTISAALCVVRALLLSVLHGTCTLPPPDKIIVKSDEEVFMSQLAKHDSPDYAYELAPSVVRLRRECLAPLRGELRMLGGWSRAARWTGGAPCLIWQAVAAEDNQRATHLACQAIAGLQAPGVGTHRLHLAPEAFAGATAVRREAEAAETKWIPQAEPAHRVFAAWAESHMMTQVANDVYVLDGADEWESGWA